MKRIWNSIGKKTKDTNFLQKAVKQVEEIEKGTKKVPIPKVETEQKRFAKAQEDNFAKEYLASKNRTLVDNMQQFHIKSSDPPERWTSTKDLPTRESEWLHRNDPVWEYGFYEPPVEKIPKNKLLFKEAMEVLRAKQELDVVDDSNAGRKRREIANIAMEGSLALKRVDADLIEDVYQFFRPFERKDYQKVVNKHDLAKLQDHLQGRGDTVRLADGAKEYVQELLRDKRTREEYEQLSDSKKTEFEEAVKQLRESEHERLELRLKEMNELEEKQKRAVNDAKTKLQWHKDNQEKKDNC